MLTVVVPLFQGARTISELLQSLADQVDPPDFEIVVADNGSTDDGVERIRGFDQLLPMRVVGASHRRGQTVARNAGAAAARGDFLIFLDQDDRVSPNYLSEMRKALHHHPIVAARVDLSELNPGWRATVRRLAQESGLAEGPPYPWGYGGTLGVRRSLFEAVSGFDEGLQVAGEDEDFCWRAQATGATIAFVPSAVVHYRLPSTWRALFRQGSRYGRAQLDVDFKHRRVGRPKPAAGRQLLRLALELPRAVMSPSRRRRLQFAFLSGRRLGALKGWWVYRGRWSG